MKLLVSSKQVEELFERAKDSLHPHQPLGGADADAKKLLGMWRLAESDAHGPWTGQVERFVAHAEMDAWQMGSVDAVEDYSGIGERMEVITQAARVLLYMLRAEHDDTSETQAWAKLIESAWQTAQFMAEAHFPA